MSGSRALTYEQALHGHKLWKHGYTLKEVGEILHVDRITVRRNFDYYGLERAHKPGRRPHVRKSECI